MRCNRRKPRRRNRLKVRASIRIVASEVTRFPKGDVIGLRTDVEQMLLSLTVSTRACSDDSVERFSTGVFTLYDNNS